LQEGKYKQWKKKPIPRKSCNIAPTTEPEIDGNPSASSLELRFPHDYIPPRKDEGPPLTLQNTPDYTLVMPDIPEEVMIDEDMLGKVPQLKYVEHDITDVAKFPELAPHEYLELKVDPLKQQSIPVTKVWSIGLEQACLLNLFDIPRFRCINEVNA
jgi:hypothetical protein